MSGINLIIGNMLGSIVRPGSKLNPANVEFFINGEDAEKTDVVIPVYVHRGNQLKDSDDVFLNGLCKTNFSDVYFEDSQGNRIDHYLHSFGNYEYIKDENLGKTMAISNTGDIYATRVPVEGTSSKNLYKSSDDGETWQLIREGTGAIDCIFISSSGVIIIGEGYKVFRSSNGGTSFTEILDFMAVTGRLIYENISENINGDIYLGRYQNIFEVVIYKSSDDGETWNVVYTTTSNQHPHAIQCDPYTGNVYAGLDGGGMAIIKSTDNGATWNVIRTGAGSNATSIYFGNGYRLFGSESIMNQSIIKTTDDVNFSIVLDSGHMVSWIRELNGILFAGGDVMPRNRYVTIFVSKDNGETWETMRIWDMDSIWFGAGYHQQGSHPGKPNGYTEDVVLLGYDTNGNGYPAARLYAGGNHHSALFYVKLNLLPVLGKIIHVKSVGDYQSENVFVDPVISDLLLHYKLDEGDGTAIADSSGNNKTGTLTLGTGNWNPFNIRRAGHIYPPVTKEGASLYLNGDGYITVDGSNSDTDFQINKNFSLIMWMNTIAPTNHRLASKSYSSGRGWNFYFYGATNSLTFMYGDDEGSEFITSDQVFDYTVAVGDDTTHMVGFTLDNGSPPNIRFVINGALSNQIQLSKEIGIYAASLFFGKYYHATTFVLKAGIDDIRIYNKNLSETEVRILFEMTNK